MWAHYPIIGPHLLTISVKRYAKTHLRSFEISLAYVPANKTFRLVYESCIKIWTNIYVNVIVYNISLIISYKI